MTTVEQPDVATDRWVRVCRLDQLMPGRGVAARVGDRQVALFRWPGGTTSVGDDLSPPVDPVPNDRNGGRPPGEGDVVYAIDNRDPFSGAYVMSRGIVGDRAGIPKVASPVYKQTFDLRTGRCLGDETVALDTFPVRITPDGWVEVEAPA